MLREILYDRIIDVTLYRRAKQVEALHAVHNTGGYKESVVKGKRILSSIGRAENITTLTYDPRENPGPNGKTKEQVSITTRIEFYEGKTRQVYAGIKRMADGSVKDVYKTIRATGRTFTYRTMDEMKQGIRPDGSPLETGDKCRVVQDNSLWNVYVYGSPKNLLTEETVEVDAITLRIPCTQTSLKPDVSFGIKLLPGQNCYGATLKIKNLNLGTINIRSWDKMIIRAGYRNGATATYTCPIFSSYIESPNPDGVTVFEGLTVGSAENDMTDHLVTFNFRQEKMTLEALIRGVAQGIMDNIEVAISIDVDILQKEITIEKRTIYAQNGMAVLNWLRDTVNSFIQEITGGQSTAFLQLAGNILSVMIINGPSKTPDKLENIINLDAVSGATFSGTALTVTAPWNPALNPGDLFFMPPEFINGSMLPNVLSTRNYRNEDNLYRVITMSIDFATVDNTNKMTILAVPAQWAGELPESLSTNMGDAEYAAAIAEWYKQDKTREYDIGEEEKVEVANQRTKEPTKEEKVQQVFENNSTILSKWGSWQSVSLQGVPYVDCLSKASYYYIYDMPGGPKLEKGKKGTANEGCYYETKAWLEEQQLNKALSHMQNTGISALALWIPLIALGTYWKRDFDNKRNASHDWAEVKLENINFLDFNTGHSLYIPTFPSGGWRANRTTLTAFRDIWKDFYLAFKEGWPDLEGYALQWRAMYYYLGGTSDIG